MNLRVAVRGIMVNDGKLLCAKLTGYRHGVPSTYWCVPGGGIDDNEGLEPALAREIVEETGVKPDIGRLLFVQQYEFKGVQQLEFFFEIKNALDYLEIDVAKTTHGATEIAEIGFVDPTTNDVLPKFLTEQPLDELLAQAPKVFNYL